MLNDKTYNPFLHYKYKCYRLEDEITFVDFNWLNQFTTERILKISKLRNKETFKHLTLTELSNLKTLIEEIIQEKQKDMTKRN